MAERSPVAEVGGVERRAQAAFRRLVVLSGRLDACKPVGTVAQWGEIVAAATVFAELALEARDEAVRRARVLNAARIEQLLLLPSGTVVEEDVRPSEWTCAACDRQTRAHRCRCGKSRPS